MDKRVKPIRTNYHIRFNPQNKRHYDAAVYMNSVKDKFKTAFIAAAIESYRQEHPHGIDYDDLEEIQKKSWNSYQPKTPILENLKRVKRQPYVKVHAVMETQVVDAEEETQTSKAIDEAMNHYGIG